MIVNNAHGILKAFLNHYKIYDGYKNDVINS